MRIDVVEEVRQGKAHFEWKDILREHKGHRLYVPVLRDAMKFDNVPAMTWDWKPTTTWDPAKKQLVPDERTMDGVRLPGSPRQLQEIGDLIGGMLMVPLVIEEIWLQADIKFTAVVNTANRHPGIKGRVIVANSDYFILHQAIEEQIAKLGGDDGNGLISCVGKYWCLVNDLLNGRKAPATQLDCACNFGWFHPGSGQSVSGRCKRYQGPGFHHDYNHWDPSQTIRLMHQWGRLFRAGSDVEEHVFLPDICVDKELCGLLNYTNKPLTYLRQIHPGPKLEMMGTITLPEVTITASPDDLA